MRTSFLKPAATDRTKTVDIWHIGDIRRGCMKECRLQSDIDLQSTTSRWRSQVLKQTVRVYRMLTVETLVEIPCWGGKTLLKKRCSPGKMMQAAYSHYLLG